MSIEFVGRTIGAAIVIMLFGFAPVRSAQEEDAVVGADGVARWALKRQTEYHLVRPR